MSDIAGMINLKTWAIVGANENPDKFGCKIFKFMRNAGYNVVPVNPGLATVFGNKCYPSVKDIPYKPDVVDLVVPAKIGEQVLRDCAEAGIKNVWLQPGADAESVVKLGLELGLTVVHHACVMVEARKFGHMDQ